jgi:uridine nucleosidase
MFFAHTYATVFGLSEGPPLHDPLAVAVLLADHPDPEHRIDFSDNDGERWDVNVVLEGEQLGRTVATRTQIEDGTGKGMGIRIPRSLDLEKFWQTLEACMKSADEMTGYVM